jgi:sigma-B regulation protein RsbU (phosphoserine phosphatase)
MIHSGSGPLIELEQRTQDAYQDLCDRLHETTGWPVQFLRLQNEPVLTVESALLERGEYCWWQRVEDGTHCIGLLIVNLPETEPANASFEAMVGLAKSIALLMNQQAKSERKQTEQFQDLQLFSKLAIDCLPELGLKLGLGQTLREILAAAVRSTGYESASFYLLNPATDRLKLRLVHGLSAHDLSTTNRTLLGSAPDFEAFSEGFSFVERKSASDDQWLPRDAVCGLAVAVQSALIPLGTLWVYDRRPHHFPDRDALNSLTPLASQLALVLERLILLSENESQQRVQTELRLVAEHLNRAFRPELPPTCGLDVTYRCQSRYEISGDLCEILSLSDISTAIAVGDASGNSIPAALVATAVKGALKSMIGSPVNQDCTPSVVMGRLNQALDTIAGDHQFMSLFYGVYDATKRKLTYSSAGHPAPILVRNGAVTMLQADGFLLGILDGVEFDSIELTLQSGDLLVIYTDGISETHGVNGRLFAEAGIIRAIETAGTDSLERILETIWQQAEAFACPSLKKKSDDRSLMVLRVD